MSPKGSGLHICSSDLQDSLWGAETCQGNRVKLGSGGAPRSPGGRTLESSQISYLRKLLTFLVEKT